MARKSKTSNEGRGVEVEYVAHRGQKRSNIPTAELAGFVVKDEQAPPVLRYPRDTSLDPQLVWKGKDEQDGRDLEVASVPIYIQEHIHPRAVIEDLRREQADGQPRQASLFGDFNGLELSERVDFYRHSHQWTNRMVLGDSLLVMASLAQKEGLKGQVQMVYLDPPYGIKFGSNWQVSTRKRDVRDGRAEDATREPEQVRAFRDTWKLGIHSYLAYWRDRLTVAYDLLTETGSIFVQIGDENVHLVRCMMDEVFGSENFISQISFAKTTGFSGNYLSNVSDYLVWYGKDASQTKFRQIYKQKEAGEIGATAYHPLSEFPVDRGFWRDGDLTRLGTSDQLTSQGASTASEQRIVFAGRGFLPPVGLHWKTTVDGLKRLIASGRIFLVGNTLRYLRLLDDFNVYPLSSTWTDTGIAGFTADKVYAVQTLPKVIERCLLMTTDPGDLVLDPTCGSGATAYVAEQWGRRWITIDTSRVAIALARTRLMSARFPYYTLADSPEGTRKEAEVMAQAPPAPLPATQADIRKGFVYRRVPHVTLKSIANNPDIDGIHARWQERLEPLRAQLNKLLEKSWEEWQVPAEADKAWPARARELHQRWWELRRERQKDIDAAISRHADSETLYNQPYEESKVVRVTGPFTVESLSPHRVLSPEQPRPKSEQAAAQSGAGQFELMVLENLRKAGVQQYDKKEHISFQRVEPFAGVYIQGAGEYEQNGQARRAAICIGPEHGTVGQELVKEAAKEAMRGVGFDLLIVCGLAFDAHAAETAGEVSPGTKGGKSAFAVAEEKARYGKLPVLLARIHPDLPLGDEFLKRTGAGNLFMVFGEPDIELKKDKKGKLTVEIKGLDVYDPTTGEVRSHSTDDIACWFIDTDYNDEAFFVRHAYFCGNDEPYDKLKRALKADIDEAAWSSLYSTVSRPFDPPSTGRIAIKVINHYGDEVLKVYTV